MAPQGYDKLNTALYKHISQGYLNHRNVVVQFYMPVVYMHLWWLRKYYDAKSSEDW